jgi:pyruvate formate lyase activating enzyme
VPLRLIAPELNNVGRNLMVQKQQRMSKGLVFDVQRYSIHDGPGIRTIVFFKGCPLRCKWCANPESQLSNIEIMHISNKCIRCGKCILLCKQKAITFKQNEIYLNRKNCNLCGLCVENCNTGAMKFIGKAFTEKELLSEVIKDELFYIASNGGVTVSGGEPFMQHSFLKTFLIECKERGLNTAVETSGYVETDIMNDILEYIDILLMDLKHVDDEKHVKGTGASNKLILKNWNMVARKTNNVICRVPVIPDFNDSIDEIYGIADFIKNIGIKEMHLLPYHKLGEGKYKSLGLNYELTGTQPPSNDKIQKYKEICESLDLKVQIGG